MEQTPSSTAGTPENNNPESVVINYLEVARELVEKYRFKGSYLEADQGPYLPRTAVLLDVLAQKGVNTREKYKVLLNVLKQADEGSRRRQISRREDPTEQGMTLPFKEKITEQQLETSRMLRGIIGQYC